MFLYLKKKLFNFILRETPCIQAYTSSDTHAEAEKEITRVQGVNKWPVRRAIAPPHRILSQSRDHASERASRATSERRSHEQRDDRQSGSTEVS